jgi:hypothetical protein
MIAADRSGLHVRFDKLDRYDGQFKAACDRAFNCF